MYSLWIVGISGEREVLSVYKQQPFGRLGFVENLAKNSG